MEAGGYLPESGDFPEGLRTEFGDAPGGFDLSGATKLFFLARGNEGGETVTIGIGIIGNEKTYHDSTKEDRKIRSQRKKPVPDQNAALFLGGGHRQTLFDFYRRSGHRVAFPALFYLIEQGTVSHRTLFNREWIIA